MTKLQALATTSPQFIELALEGSNGQDSELVELGKHFAKDPVTFAESITQTNDKFATLSIDDGADFEIICSIRRKRFRLNVLPLRLAGTDKVFYVGQYLTQGCFILDLETLEYVRPIGQDHFDITMLEDLFENVGDLTQAVNDVRAETKSTVWEIGCQSPFHFFWETLGGLGGLFEANTNIKNLFSETRGQFFNLETLLPSTYAVHPLADSERWTRRDLPLIFIRLGYPLGELDPKIRVDLENGIRFETDRRIEEALLPSNRFKLWVDLAMTNRTWNAEETLEALRHTFANESREVFFIFDGETSPDNDTTLENEPPLWLSDSSYWNSKKYLWVGGKSFPEKLAIANQVDFYLASGTTGSLVVSRFANKSGIVLSDPALFENPNLKAIFDHPGKIRIPKELFGFIEDNPHPAWKSFTLLPEPFAEWVESFLKDRNPGLRKN